MVDRPRRAGPAVVGVVVAALLLASTAGGTGIGPVDAAVEDARRVSTSVLGADGSKAATGIDRARLERAIHRRVNEHRERVGLEPLAWSDPLREVARSHSEDLAERETVSHRGADGSTVADRYREAGVDCRATTAVGTRSAGENLLSMTVERDTSERRLAERAVGTWLDSPEHRSLLLENWTAQGIGVHVSRTDDELVVYVTQNVCY